jgi:hypothetical protein
VSGRLPPCWPPAWLWGVACCCACGGDPAHAGGADPGTPGLHGVLKSQDESLLPDRQILACMSTTCLFGESDGNARFAFDVDANAEIALKTPEQLDVQPRLGALLIPIRLGRALGLDVGVVHVPTLPDGALLAPISAGTRSFDAGDGLTLTMASADLTLRLGDTSSDVAARRIPDADLRPIDQLGAERLVTEYALHPFAATSSTKIAVRAPSQLPAGSKLRFRTISELDGSLSEPALGHSDGAFLATDPGQGLTELTWLVISVEAP